MYEELLKINDKKTRFENEQKILTGMLAKKIYRWQISIWKDALHHKSSGKCKLKHLDTTIYLLEWLKSKTLTTPNADKDVDQQEISFTLGRNAK